MGESRVLEIRPASTRGTLMTALLPTLGAAGVACTEARLAGILGHAFTFSMGRGGGEVWQLANIEWCFFFRDLDLLPFRFVSFDAVLRGGGPWPSSSASPGSRVSSGTFSSDTTRGIERTQFAISLMSLPGKSPSTASGTAIR